MRHLYVDRNTSTFAKAEDPRVQLRFMRNTQPKTSGSVKLTNIQNTILFTGPVPVAQPAGCEPCAKAEENVSIRLVISGSLQNKVAVKAQLEAFIHNLTLATDDLLGGFLPAITTPFVDLKPTGE